MSRQLYSIIYFLFTISPLSAQLFERIDDPVFEATNIFFLGGSNNDLFFTYTDWESDPVHFHFDGSNFIFIPTNYFDYYDFRGKDENYSYLDRLDTSGPPDNSVVRFDNAANSSEEILASEPYINVVYACHFEDVLLLKVANFSFTDFAITRYEDNEHQLLVHPDGNLFDEVISSLENEAIISYRDSLDDLHLCTYDGNQFLDIEGSYPNLKSSTVLDKIENQVYILLKFLDQETNLYIYEEGEVVKKAPSENVKYYDYYGFNPVTHDVFISFTNFVDNQVSTFKFSDDSFTPLSVPEGLSFSRISNVFDSTPYVYLVDDQDIETLYKLDGSNFEEVNVPVGYKLEEYLDVYNNAPYYFVSDQNDDLSPAKLNIVDNTLEVVPGPFNLSLWKYYTTFEDKMLFAAIDSIYGVLLMYNGSDYTESIPNNVLDGTPGLGRFLVKDSDVVYLSYSINYQYGGGYNSMFKLVSTNGIPESEDMEINIDEGSTYYFEINDFAFSDIDAIDTFHSILITEIDLTGEFFLNADPIAVGDTILVDEIQSMSYTHIPNSLDTVSFSFKVGDGQHYSHDNYKWTIQVVQEDTTSTLDNALQAFTKVYPVPAEDFIKIEVNADQKIGDLSITIFNNFGQSVMVKNYPNAESKFSTVIPLEDLISGQYYAVGTSSGGKFYKSFVVSR